VRKHSPGKAGVVERKPLPPLTLSCVGGTVARINVEQTALTDPRFQILATLLGVTRQHALGCMIEVWNECQERETFYLSGDLLDAIFSRADSGLLLARSELAREHKSHGWYIRGSRWRTGWLKKRREDGRKGGRPKKTIGLTVGIDVKQQADNPPAPAPAPAPNPKQKELLSNSPAANADVITLARVRRRPRLNGHTPERLLELTKLFGLFYDDYPRHEGKQAALKAFLKANPTKDDLLAIARDLRRRVTSGGWEPDDPEKIKFIPLPATYVNGRRWEDSNA